MSSRKERLETLNKVLDMCRMNEWSYDTPNVAGKVYNALKPLGYTKRTVQDYVRTIVELLEVEKQCVRAKGRDSTSLWK